MSIRSKTSAVAIAIGLLSAISCSAPHENNADAPAAGELPCEVQAALLHKCQRCHSASPAAVSMVPIVTFADTRARYFAEPVWKLIGDVIEVASMPPEPPELTTDERSTLLEWSHAGGPPRPLGTVCH